MKPTTFGHAEATNFGQADDKLSRVASALWRLMQQTAFAYEEIEAFHAPSECYGLVAKGERRAELALLAEHGYTPATFNAAIAGRVAYRWIYFNQFGVDEEAV